MFRPPFANQSKAKRSCSYPLYFAPILSMYIKVLFVSIGTASTRPIEKLCTRSSQRSCAPSKHRIGNSNDKNKIASPPAKKEHGDSCGSGGLDETPEGVSTRRLI